MAYKKGSGERNAKRNERSEQQHPYMNFKGDLFYCKVLEQLPTESSYVCQVLFRDRKDSKSEGCKFVVVKFFGPSAFYICKMVEAGKINTSSTVDLRVWISAKKIEFEKEGTQVSRWINEITANILGGGFDRDEWRERLDDYLDASYGNSEKEDEDEGSGDDLPF